ncbi:MAG: hypothetical protein ACKOGA_24845, partial [Planctomycetaceae bacterium]
MESQAAIRHVFLDFFPIATNSATSTNPYPFPVRENQSNTHDSSAQSSYPADSAPWCSTRPIPSQPSPAILRIQALTG